MAFNEVLFKDIISGVSMMLAVSLPQSLNADDPIVEKWTPLYIDSLSKVLGAVNWEFAIKSESLVSMADDLGGYNVPASYVRFLNLGSHTSKCGVCSHSSKEKFTLSMVDGRLYPNGQTKCLGSHSVVYFISNDIEYKIVSPAFKDLVRFDLAIRLAGSYEKNEMISTWFELYQSQLLDSKMRNTQEFEGASDTHTYRGYRNSFAPMGHFDPTKKYMR